MTMIRKNLLHCKLNFQENLLNLLESWQNDFDPALERCPSCGAKGRCRRFAYYQRHLIYATGQTIADHLVRILRVKCVCGHTHAVLPDFFVPYRMYSLSFILQILQIWFSRAMTLAEIHEVYDVPHTTLFRWVSVFTRHKSWYTGPALADRIARLAFLERLIASNPFSAFALKFYLQTLCSFLQLHANPANCDHLPPSWPPPEEATT